MRTLAAILLLLVGQIALGQSQPTREEIEKLLAEYARGIGPIQPRAPVIPSPDEIARQKIKEYGEPAIAILTEILLEPPLPLPQPWSARNYWHYGSGSLKTVAASMLSDLDRFKYLPLFRQALEVDEEAMHSVVPDLLVKGGEVLEGRRLALRLFQKYPNSQMLMYLAVAAVGKAHEVELLKEAVLRNSAPAARSLAFRKEHGEFLLEVFERHPIARKAALAGLRETQLPKAIPVAVRIFMEDPSLRTDWNYDYFRYQWGESFRVLLQQVPVMDDEFVAAVFYEHEGSDNDIGLAELKSLLASSRFAWTPDVGQRPDSRRRARIGFIRRLKRTNYAEGLLVEPAELKSAEQRLHVAEMVTYTYAPVSAAMELLSDPDPRVRHQAHLAAGRKSHSPEEGRVARVARILEGLNDRDPLVRLAVLQAEGWLLAWRLDLLKKAAGTDPDARVREAALKRLRELTPR